MTGSACPGPGETYTTLVPKLWNETVEAHRRQVRDAILDTAAALVAEHGLLSVTMSQIAADSGIGRATLYKYFPEVEAIIAAWHDRQVTAHLQHLAEVRDGAGDAGEQLRAVLGTYALMIHGRPQHSQLVAVVHRSEHVAEAHRRLHAFIEDLLREAVKTGDVRGDVAPHELASYCMNAIMAAGGLVSKAAVRRLLKVTLAGLQP